MPRSNASTATIPPLIGFAITVAILYFARDLLIPLAFALLFAFLLSPIVKRLEGWRVPRVPAVVLVFVVASAIVTIIGWLVTTQLIQIAEGMKDDTATLQRKIASLEGESKGLNDIISTIEQLGKEVNTPKWGAPAPRQSQPVQVEVVEQHNLIQAIREYAGGLMKPLGTLGLIAVFTLFMLIDRENLRNRLLRLTGQQKLQATTKAMDDAGQRVSRYVLMQFVVNAIFGTVIALGLMFLGVKSPLLWGVLGMLLRFLPYIGPVIAGLLPFTLTLLASEGWRTPLFVVGLFFVTELIIGNVVEPLLYGVHTGLSAVAILVSAVFWTVLWGPVGLVLATPLTVCLSVLGRYSPQLEFLDIVLGDEPVLSPDVIFYQRLLALDQQDALNVLETLAKDKPLITVFDEIVIPALAMAERDRHTGQLDAKRENFIVQSINEFVTELTEAEAVPMTGRPVRSTRVFCLPAHDAADEIAAAMCAHFLTQDGYPAIAFPVTDSPGELVHNLGIQPEDIVCISAVPPFAAGHARRIAKSIRESGAAPLVVAGLWTYGSTSTVRLERLKKSLSSVVATTLAEAVAQVESVEQSSPVSGNSRA